MKKAKSKSQKYIRTFGPQKKDHMLKSKINKDFGKSQKKIHKGPFEAKR